MYSSQLLPILILHTGNAIYRDATKAHTLYSSWRIERVLADFHTLITTRNKFISKEAVLPATPWANYMEWERKWVKETVQLNQLWEVKMNDTCITQQKRRHSYKCFALDSVLFDNDKISNQNGCFHREALCCKILPVFTFHKKRKQSTCWKKLFPKVFCMKRIAGMILPVRDRQGARSKTNLRSHSVKRICQNDQGKMGPVYDRMCYGAFSVFWKGSSEGRRFQVWGWMFCIWFRINASLLNSVFLFFSRGGQNCLSSNGPISGRN